MGIFFKKAARKRGKKAFVAGKPQRIVPISTKASAAVVILLTAVFAVGLVRFNFEALAKEQTPFAEKQRLAKGFGVVEPESAEKQDIPFPPPRKAGASVDMEQLQRMLAHAKKISGNYRA